MPKYKVVVTDDRHGDFQVEKEVLQRIGAEIEICDCNTPEEVAKACKDADGILLNLSPMPAEAIERLEKCKVIARYGVGYDNVDVAACTGKGIYVTNVTDYCSEEVSDQALALLMACVRKVVKCDAQVRQGRWNIGKEQPIHRIEGNTFAFLGFGMIARALLRKIKGFNLGRILVYDPFLDTHTVASYGAQKVDWETALKEADYISVHMPLNAQTKGIIDSKAFELMKPSVILINTSRGAVIDENALIAALETNKINSAGIDVFTKEPLEADSKLKKLDNCVLTDHVGWYSKESIVELKRKAAENVRDVLQGKKPKYPVNNL